MPFDDTSVYIEDRVGIWTAIDTVPLIDAWLTLEPAVTLAPAATIRGFPKLDKSINHISWRY